MYLKINFENSTKKVMFKDELRNEAAFFELLERFTKLKRSEFLATFNDAENDTVPLLDQFDLDYFVTDGQSRNFLVVNVVSNVHGTKPAESAKPVDITPDVLASGKTEETLHPFLDNIVQNLQNFATLPLFLGQRQTSEMNIQTETPATVEKCSETITCQQTNTGQQTQVTQQETKETQTKEKAVTSSDELKILSERIEALERSFHQQSLSQSQIVQPQEPPKVVKVDESLSKSQVTTSHVGITCDGCKKWPIVGKRYKCLVCHDFDLCQTCEEKNDHMHPMVRCSTQANNFVLERIRRKYVKVSGQGCLRDVNEARGCRGIEGAIRGLFSKGRHGPRMFPHGPFPQPFHNQTAPAQAPAPAKEEANPQADFSMKSKEEMLQFMLPDNPEVWPRLLRKYGHMDLSEFCAMVNLHDPQMPE